MTDHDDHFADKSMLITGAGRGIGRAIAHRFAGLGCNLLLVARSKNQFEETRRSTTSAGKIITATADIADAAQIEKVAALARKEFGGVDYLVNNAGFVAMGSIGQLNADDLRALIRINIEGFVFLTKAVWNDLAIRHGA